MSKNKKGFTLVELLAAIVILGILAVFAIPMITRMVENSRNKMYVSDAEKLISRAEYQMKASSSTISKPDVGDCIVISLAYLQASELESAPNGGEYNEDQSYVVVKNVGNGTLEYSAAIVEDLKKGGHKGLPLTKYTDILTSSATQKVTYFENADLIDIESIDKAYINSQIGSSYIQGDVSAVYHYREITDNSSVNPYKKASPVIDKIEYDHFGSLQAVIKVYASDADTLRSDLKIYYSFGNDSLSNVENFGDQLYHTISVDFSQSPFNYSYAEKEDVTYYVQIEDPDGNKSSLRVATYSIYGNVAPTIDDIHTTVTKRDSDDRALTVATITLEVSDDIDQVEELMICAIDSDNSEGSTECNDYRRYSDLVHNKKFDYQFRFCSGGCVRDGTTHYVTVFAKDTSNAESHFVMPYQFSSNVAPDLLTASVESTTDSFPTTGNRNVLVSATASDDLTALSDLTVIISDGINSQNYPYNTTANYKYPFTITGSYDGFDRTISVKIMDSENAVSTAREIQYQMYRNQGPTIDRFAVRSNGTACGQPSLCPTASNGTENGSLNAYIDLSLSDDLDSEEQLDNAKVCISENINDCLNDSNYHLYSDYKGKMVPYTFTGSYNGTLKTLFVRVKDSFLESTDSQVEYRLYQDSKPVISDFHLVSDTESLSAGGVNLKDTIIHFDIADDFSEDGEMTMTILRGEDVVVEETILTDFYDLVDSGNVGSDGNPIYNKEFKYQFAVSEQYDGETYHFTIKVKDKLGQESDPYQYEYTVYANSGPYTEGDPIVVQTPNDYDIDTSVLDFYFNTRFKDDIDTVFPVYFCYSENEEGTNSVCYTRTIYTPEYDDQGNPTDPSTWEIAEEDAPVYTTGVFRLTRENLFADINNFTGQSIYVYATTYDSLDQSLVAETKKVKIDLYDTLHTTPTVSYAVANYDGSDIIPADPDDPDAQAEIDQDITVYFQVKDLFDSYQVCVSQEDNQSNCTSFIGPNASTTSYFDGTDMELHSVTFHYTGAIEDAKVYVFAKGKNSNLVGRGEGDLVPQGTCTVKDVNHPIYSFAFNGSGSGLSPSVCNNKCYHYNIFNNDTNTVSRSYKLTYTYKDINVNQMCSNFKTEKVETWYCDSVPCFYNSSSNNYEQYAIGTQLMADDQNWTVEINGVTYVNDSHYQLYRSSYTQGDPYITLTKVNQKISPAALADSKYSFSYVRVADMGVE